MSYRDLRNFTEHLRVLGYPKNISLGSFRDPNFPLVVDIMKWLVDQFDQEVNIVGSAMTMEERVTFIRNVAVFMVTKANIKLNTKKLYSADGYSVREMLKVTTVLYNSMNTNNNNELSDEEITPTDIENKFDLATKTKDINRARQLSTELTQQGAVLYDLLAKETEYREKRKLCLSRQVDTTQIEQTLRSAIETTRKQIQNVKEQIENVSASENVLDVKIERKRAELDRSEKRLHSMHKIKPAYQAEYKTLETEIAKLFDDYLLRYRCIEGLKQQLSLMDKKEAEIAEEQQNAVLQLIQKYESEDVLVNETVSDETDTEDEDMSPKKPEKEKIEEKRPNTRLRIKTAGKANVEVNQRMYGTMTTRVAGRTSSIDDIRDVLDDESDDEVFSDEISDHFAPSKTKPPRYDIASGSDSMCSLLHRYSSKQNINIRHQSDDLPLKPSAPIRTEESSLDSSDGSELRMTTRPVHSAKPTELLTDEEF